MRQATAKKGDSRRSPYIGRLCPSAREEKLMSYDLWKLGTYAGYAEAGWHWTNLRDGVKGLVHPDRDCAHSDCPEALTRHRHTPTVEQKEQMQRYVTGYLTSKFEAEEAEKGRRADITELCRMTEL
jgi:hypothetical protein